MTSSLCLLADQSVAVKPFDEEFIISKKVILLEVLKPAGSKVIQWLDLLSDHSNIEQQDQTVS